MSTAATEATLIADLVPLEGVEGCLVRHMARAHHFAEACFDRAEQAETPDQRDAALRLATRLITLFSRSLNALNRHRAHLRQDAKMALKQQQSAGFDHALHLAALADAAVAQKTKREAATAAAGTAPAAAALPPGPPPGGNGTPRLSRQQRRAAARRLRKAGGTDQKP